MDHEDGWELVDGTAIIEARDQLFQSLQQLGQLGLSIIVAGPPNSGKSSTIFSLFGQTGICSRISPHCLSHFFVLNEISLRVFEVSLPPSFDDSTRSTLVDEMKLSFEKLIARPVGVRPGSTTAPSSVSERVAAAASTPLVPPFPHICLYCFPLMGLPEPPHPAAPPMPPGMSLAGPPSTSASCPPSPMMLDIPPASVDGPMAPQPDPDRSLGVWSLHASALMDAFGAALLRSHTVVVWTHANEGDLPALFSRQSMLWEKTLQIASNANHDRHVQLAAAAAAATAAATAAPAAAAKGTKARGPRAASASGSRPSLVAPLVEVRFVPLDHATRPVLRPFRTAPVLPPLPVLAPVGSPPRMASPTPPIPRSFGLPTYGGMDVAPSAPPPPPLIGGGGGCCCPMDMPEAVVPVAPSSPTTAYLSLCRRYEAELTRYAQASPPPRLAARSPPLLQLPAEVLLPAPIHSRSPPPPAPPTAAASSGLLPTYAGRRVASTNPFPPRAQTPPARLRLPSLDTGPLGPPRAHSPGPRLASGGDDELPTAPPGAPAEDEGQSWVLAESLFSAPVSLFYRRSWVVELWVTFLEQLDSTGTFVFLRAQAAEERQAALIGASPAANSGPGSAKGGTGTWAHIKSTAEWTWLVGAAGRSLGRGLWATGSGVVDLGRALVWGIGQFVQLLHTLAKGL
ncbi:hypothetical protein PAPYR_3206 [Paratrimastix pyriformis]|uniref:G domain-containing protein n=1 Tax=Paratrimastix pyriformis TaxID=342808 RepID=A0ABQ8UN15_9EUKA|nr:hypothetical protein PAPYR_3206 [Paratrimastix pyriformis]